MVLAYLTRATRCFYSCTFVPCLFGFSLKIGDERILTLSWWSFAMQNATRTVFLVLPYPFQDVLNIHVAQCVLVSFLTHSSVNIWIEQSNRNQRRKLVSRQRPNWIGHERSLPMLLGGDQSFGQSILKRTAQSRTSTGGMWGPFLGPILWGRV